MEPGNGSLSTSSGNIVLEQSDRRTSSNVLECQICLEPLRDPVATLCGHVFCWPCLYRWLQNRPKPCPVCRNILRRDINIFPLFGSREEVRSQGTAEPTNSRAVAAETRAETASSGSVIPPRPNIPPRLSNINGTARMEGSGSLNIIPPRPNSSTPPRPNRSTPPVFNETAAPSMGAGSNQAFVMVSDVVDIFGGAHRRVVRQLDHERARADILAIERVQLRLYVNSLEGRNSVLVRQSDDSRERERRLVEERNQMRQRIATLQRRLDRAHRRLARANRQLAPRANCPSDVQTPE